MHITAVSMDVPDPDATVRCLCDVPDVGIHEHGDAVDLPAGASRPLHVHPGGGHGHLTLAHAGQWRGIVTP